VGLWYLLSRLAWYRSLTCEMKILQGWLVRFGVARRRLRSIREDMFGRMSFCSTAILDQSGECCCCAVVDFQIRSKYPFQIDI